MIRLFRIVFFFLFLSSVNIFPLFALQIPKRAEGYVSDYAHIISSPVKEQLENKLRQFENETSNQLIVVTFPSLEGESLEDFSICLAGVWRPGQKGKDNGAILLIFKNDHKVRIEVGYGLEGALPDATAKMIIVNEITPRFREGDFDGGIEHAVDSIIQATHGEYKGKPETQSADSNSSNAFLIFFFAILILYLIPRFMFFFPAGMIWTSSGYSRRSGFGGWGGGGFGGGGFSGGGGGFGGGGASGSW